MSKMIKIITKTRKRRNHENTKFFYSTDLRNFVSFNILCFDFTAFNLYFVLRGKSGVLKMVLIFFIACIFNCSFNNKPHYWREISPYVPEDYKNQVFKVLSHAKSNRNELIKIIKSVSSDQTNSASFIVANMPQVDLAAAKASVLIDNIELAYRARSSFSWSKYVPDSLFQYYVLPYRVSQEPIENWRPMFYDSLCVKIKQAENNNETISMSRAAAIVDGWCGERVKYKPTQRRDQGPLESLKSGFGRCEEIMIVQISAYRAVGIPAREAWTPYWAAGDDNHAWTEVWVDGKWTGPPAKRAALVFTSVYGVPPNDTSLYRKGSNYAIVNVTNNYTKTGTMKVSLTRQGRPVKNTPVIISVFNYGSLRPIARILTDRSGKAEIPVGEGSYFITSGTQKDHTWVVEYVTAGETREVALNLDKPRELNAQFWLRYNPPEE